MRFLFDSNKDQCEPVKTVNSFNNNYVQYESIGNKDKNLSIKEYINIFRLYLSDIIKF